MGAFDAAPYLVVGAWISTLHVVGAYATREEAEEVAEKERQLMRDEWGLGGSYVEVVDVRTDCGSVGLRSERVVS